jgi:hypothetical protein
MGRIEDNDADRIERMRLEAQAAAKKADTKRTDNDRQFGQLVAKAQDTKGQQEQKSQQRSEQQNSANQMLMARRGIKSNNESGARIDERAMGNDAKRASGKSRDMDNAKNSAALLRQNQGGSKTSTNMAVGNNAGHGGRNQKSPNREEKKEAVGKEASDKAANFAALSQGAIAPLDGLGAQSSSGTAGAPGALSSKEVIDELVARVQQGVEAKAGRTDVDTIRIELKDNVLAGATLTFSHEVGSGKLQLKIETGDEEVERLLSASATAQELSRALKHSGLILSELEVNDNKVVRS